MIVESIQHALKAFYFTSHALRLQIKRLRYAIQFVGAAYGGGRAMQRQLGGRQSGQAGRACSLCASGRVGTTPQAYRRTFARPAAS